MKPPTEPWGEVPSPLHHLSPSSPPPTYGESSLRHIASSSRSVSSEQRNTPDTADTHLLPPSPSTLSSAYLHLTPATHILIPSARQVWNLHLASWVFTFLFLFKAEFERREMRTSLYRNAHYFFPCSRASKSQQCDRSCLFLFMLLMQQYEANKHAQCSSPIPTRPPGPGYVFTGALIITGEVMALNNKSLSLAQVWRHFHQTLTGEPSDEF